MGTPTGSRRRRLESADAEHTEVLKFRQRGGNTDTLSDSLDSSSSSDRLNDPKSDIVLDTIDELRSNGINFLSDEFNPIAALRSNIDPVQVIPDKTAPILENVLDARTLLPLSDPFRCEL